MSEPSNSTISWVPPICMSENWSNGSALAVLIALAIGCLAHPRGSLTFNKSGRIWRLSPHLGFAEALNLVFSLLEGLLRGYSLHTVCVTLLAVREGNCWTTAEYDSFQEAWKDKLTKEEESKDASNEISRDTFEIQATSSSEKQQALDEDVIPPVGRSATIEAEEGRANVDLHRRINTVAGLHDDDKNISEKKDEDDTIMFQQASLDTVFLSQLRETERYEKGLTYRLLVWIPMLLALVKIFSVTGGSNIWGPKVCGYMFFYSWLVTELITIVASRRQLSEKQQDEVLKLGRLWRKSWELRHERKTLEAESRALSDRLHQQSGEQRAATLKLITPISIRLYALKEPDSAFETALVDPQVFFSELNTFVLGRMCCTTLLAFNAWPLVARTASAYFGRYWNYYAWVDSFLWQPGWSFTKETLMMPIEHIVLYIAVLAPFILYAGAYFALIYSIVSPWALYILNILLLCIPGVILRLVVGLTKPVDLDSFIPGYLALGQVVLTVLRVLVRLDTLTASAKVVARLRVD